MPVIAVVHCRSMTDYQESIRRAGGEPLDVDRDSMTPADVAGRAAGLLLTGGGDVDPALYGEAAHASYQPAEPGRDAYEIDLVKAALAADLPVFAICRGMQVLNVACGGTLVQDIPSMVNGALNHEAGESRVAIAHEVWVAPDSRLFALMREKIDGETVQVNSRHHQSVAVPAAGWTVTATAPDGVAEAMEQRGDRFRLAVQWHPENFYRTGEFRPLFEGFVDACRRETQIRAGA